MKKEICVISRYALKSENKWEENEVRVFCGSHTPVAFIQLACHIHSLSIYSLYLFFQTNIPLLVFKAHHNFALIIHPILYYTCI